MSNKFSIYFDDSAPTNAAVEVADADKLWVTHSLQVRVSLRGPGSFTPTQVKVWGINGITSESEASWQPMSATITGTLRNISEEQIIYAKFWDGGSNYAEAVSSGVYYFYVDPDLSPSVSWDTLPTDDSSNVGVLKNSFGDTKAFLDKSKIKHLRFHNLNLLDFNIGGSGVNTTISTSSGSQLFQLIRNNASNYIPVAKTFSSNDKVPFIRYNDGTGFKTITTYNSSVKSGYTNKIGNVYWNSGLSLLTFDIFEFSQYGFAVIKSVEFTFDSSSGGYINTSIPIKVLVLDTNNEGVEGAPVTFTIISGTNIGSFVDSTVSTNSSGVAIATLELTTLGTAYISASVDSISSSSNSKVYCIDVPVDLQRSLLRQYEQINCTLDYNDDVLNVNAVTVAEPLNDTASGILIDTLQHDMNVFRTLLKQIKGTSNWYDELPDYFDPSNTSVNKQLTLSGIAGHTLDSKTILLSIIDDNSGAGFSVSAGASGILIIPTDARYADPVDRRGLPIYYSSKPVGTYYDINGPDDVCVVDILDFETGAEFKDANGNVIFGRLHDGDDYAGPPEVHGEGYDVFVKFYTSQGPYTWAPSDPTKIVVVYPFRKVLSDMAEYEWHRTDFVGSFEGDAELIEDIANLWSFTGAANHVKFPEWSTTGSGYAVISGSSLKEALDQLNDVIGTTSYSGTHYISPFDQIADSLFDLDTKLKELSDAVLAGVGEKYIEYISSNILAGTVHTLPNGLSYTPATLPDQSSGKLGRNLDIYVDGQLLVASTGINGGNEDMDYSESSSTSVKFHRDIFAGSNITYIIKQ